LNSFDLSQFHTLILDFDGVFTDNYVYLNTRGDELIRFSKYDSYGFNLLESARKLGWHNLDILVLSTETNNIVRIRCDKLKIRSYLGVFNKKSFVVDYLNARVEQKQDLAGVIYLGNDINDLPVLKEVGLSIAPSDAHEFIKQDCKLVLNSHGGSGFIREAVDYLLNLKNREPEEINELILNC